MSWRYHYINLFCKHQNTSRFLAVHICYSIALIYNFINNFCFQLYYNQNQWIWNPSTPRVQQMLIFWRMHLRAIPGTKGVRKQAISLWKAVLLQIFLLYSWSQVIPDSKICYIRKVFFWILGNFVGKHPPKITLL